MRRGLLRWMKEPLVHFLLAGGAMFLLAGAWQDRGGEGRTIRLERADLLAFLQGRAQVYDEDAFARLLADMTAEERAALVRDAGVQEALYREGIALGLSEADPLIRQRIVQQMRLLLVEEAAADMRASEEEMRVYFAAHSADYALPASVTFAHVFLRDGAGRADAAALLERLRGDRVGYAQAGQFGDRFLYQTNYADAGPELVGSHFGDQFAQALFDFPTGGWQGPVQSEHGWHLVFVADKAAGRVPTFADVADIVREDTLAQKRQQAADAALDRMMARYEIVAE